MRVSACACVPVRVPSRPPVQHRARAGCPHRPAAPAPVRACTRAQEAISLAMRCSTRAWEKGASRRAAVRIAASVLTKAAIDRGSKDNVGVNDVHGAYGTLKDGASKAGATPWAG